MFFEDIQKKTRLKKMCAELTSTKHWVMQNMLTLELMDVQREQMKKKGADEIYDELENEKQALFPWGPLQCTRRCGSYQ